MIKGTTTSFTFKVPYPFNEITKIVAVFDQKHNDGTTEAPLPITKVYNVLSDPPRNDGFAASDENDTEIYTVLTPHETMRFSEKEKGYAQIQVLYEDRNVTVASKQNKFTVYPVMNDEVIDDFDPSERPADDVYVFDAGRV